MRQLTWAKLTFQTHTRTTAEAFCCCEFPILHSVCFGAQSCHLFIVRSTNSLELYYMTLKCTEKKKTLRHNENGIRLLHRNHTTYDVRLIQSGTLSLRQPAMLCRCFFFLEHLFPLISVVNVTLEQTQWCSLKIPSVICNVSQASNNTKFLRLPSWHTKNE